MQVDTSMTMQPTLLNFINGQSVAAASGKTFDRLSPADGSLVQRVSEAGAPEVKAAVAAAKAALKGPWGTMDVSARAALLYKLAEAIESRTDQLLRAEIADTGKPISLASGLDSPRGAANFRVFIDMVKATHEASYQSSTPDGRGALNYTLRRPKGVIAVICPWNLPFLNVTWKLGPALALGNTVVVKPSEETPTTATMLAQIAKDVGVPDGVINIVHGFGPGSAGEFLTQHEDVAAITFTGETRTGTAIMKAAAEGTRPVSFELGGKNAGIVFADCDFDAAVEGITRSTYLNSGQVCLGTERVFVERPIFDKFVAALKAKAEALVIGDPMNAATTFGPLISLEHRDKVLSYFKRALTEGATLVTGGGVPSMPVDQSQGAWIQPTIWTGLSDDASVMREEIFGPCCNISPFDSEDEVVRRANDTRYGLSTTVWTTDLSRAHRMARNIEVGTVWINAWWLRDLRVPFGGSGLSGIGREGGEHSLDFYSEIRTVCVKL